MDTFDAEKNDAADPSIRQSFLIKDGDVQKILEIAHEISVTSNNCEGRSLLFNNLKRKLDVRMIIFMQFTA